MKKLLVLLSSITILLVFAGCLPTTSTTETSTNSESTSSANVENTKDTSETDADEDSDMEEENMEESDTEEAMEMNNYVDYSEEAVVKAHAESDNVVLFFHADWCPTCAAAEKDFKANLGELAGKVTVVKVPFNDKHTTKEHQELAKKYGIVLQHTFVEIDKDGNELQKWSSGSTPLLKKNLEI